MTTRISGPSSNWFALKKSLLRHVQPRKRRKVDGTTLSDKPPEFSRGTSSNSRKCLEPDASNEPIDRETTEVKNGESISTLRKMVLGKLEYKTSQTVPGKYLALDCEMVGVGIDGNESSLARVSLVNYMGAVILDVFVRQRERVVDYRTQWSGVRSEDLADSAKPFNEVQKTVATLIKDRIVVGHAISNDFKALLLSHPYPQIRDTQSLAYKHRTVKSRRPALRVLVKQELGIDIQSGEHDSVADARATMALFRLHKKQWESSSRPLQKVARTSLKNKSRDDIASKVGTTAPLSPSSSISLKQDRKRKRPDSETDDNNANGVAEASNLPIRTRACPSSLSNTPDTRLAIQPQGRKQGSKSHPAVLVRQKGVSSGISTVIKRTGGAKEIRRRGGDYIVVNGARGGKKTGGGGEKWWKTLPGGGKKGGVKV